MPQRSDEKKSSLALPNYGIVLGCIVVACGFLSGCWHEEKSAVELNERPTPPATEEVNSVPGHSDAEETETGEAQLFTDVTGMTGIDFRYHSGREAGEYAILESLGGGVAAFDYDRDGNVDLMFAGGGSLANKEVTPRRCRLYRNRGDFRFLDVTDPTGTAADAYFNHGAFPGDFDGDGFVDLAVSGYGGVQVLRNQGDGTFKEYANWVTHPEHPWSSSLAWCDIDNDGLLDLYVTHYVDWSWENHPTCPGAGDAEREVCAPRRFAGVSDAIYHNLGDGNFKRVDQEIGLVDGGKGLGVVAGDVNLDTHIDLYVANDTTDNFYYRNSGTGQFEEVAAIAGVAADEVGVNTGSMGVAMQDIDGDALPDIWVTNFERELFAFYRNEGADFFTHASRAVGFAALKGLYVGFGTVAMDADHDGDRDIVVANGHVSYASPYASYRQPPLFLENQDGTRFVQREPQGFFATAQTGRGLAAADLDNDGSEDLVFTHLEDPVAVLRNNSKQAGKWAIVELIGRRSNRDAVGAAVFLDSPNSPRVWLCNSGGSYLSQSDRRLILPVSDSSGATDFSVTWPSGTRESFPSPPAATTTVWIEGEGLQ